MANECDKAEYRACILDVVVLESDGTPEGGPEGRYVTDQFITVVATDVYDEGTAVVQRKACGGFALNAPAEPVFQRLDLTMTLTHPDPNLEATLMDMDILNATGRAAGLGDRSLGSLLTRHVSIELYTHRNDPDTQADDATYPYQRHLFPRTRWRRARIGEFSANGLQPDYVGIAYENANWKDGLDDGVGRAWPWGSAPSNKVHQSIPWGNPALGDLLPDVSCDFVAAVGS